METGLLYMMQEQKKINNISETYHKELSIQVKLSGLSFCVFNSILSCIETIHNLEWQEDASQKEIHKKIIDFLNAEEFLKQSFSTVRVMHSNEYFTFVPEVLFDENTSWEYLKYNTRIPASGEAVFDTIEPLGIVVVYIISPNINNLLTEHFQISECVHSSSLLLRTILPHKSSHGKEIAYAYIEKDFFYLAVFSSNQLVFFNRFEHQSIEDFLYYLLFSLEQLEIDTMEVPLFVMGNINRSMPIYNAVYKYFKNIYFFHSLREYAFCQDMDNSLVQNHFLLTHFF